MNSTIVALLMIFVFLTIISIPKMTHLITKEKEVEYYSKKLEEANKSKGNTNIRATAYLVVLLFRVTIIYYSFSVIFSFIKV